MKRFVLTAICLLPLCGASLAHNCLFFPGDAFFSAEFGRDFIETRVKGDSISLEYERFVGSTAKCGYAGYENLLVKSVPPKMLANLRLVHKVTSKEKSALPLLVYNRDFPLSSPFGVKYNEHWQEVQVGEAKLPNAIYDELAGADFVIDDWASAKEIAPLAVAAGRAPMVKPDGETGVVEKPLEIDAKKVMFVVLLGGDGQVKRFARRQEGLVFFVITESVRRYRFDRTGVAMPQRIDAPLDDAHAKRKKISKDHTALRAALAVYQLNFGKMPSGKQGLSALVKKPKAAAPKGWIPLVKKLPLDPWGKNYIWDGDVLFSLGVDGIESEDDVVEPFLLTEDGVLIPPPDG